MELGSGSRIGSADIPTCLGALKVNRRMVFNTDNSSGNAGHLYFSRLTAELHKGTEEEALYALILDLIIGS